MHVTIEAFIDDVSNALRSGTTGNKIQFLTETLGAEMGYWGDQEASVLINAMYSHDGKSTKKNKMIGLLPWIEVLVGSISRDEAKGSNLKLAKAIDAIVRFYRKQLEAGTIEKLFDDEKIALQQLLMRAAEWNYSNDEHGVMRLVTAMLTLNAFCSRKETAIDGSAFIALINALSNCIGRADDSILRKSSTSIANALRCIVHHFNHRMSSYDETEMGDAIYFLMGSINRLLPVLKSSEVTKRGELISIVSSLVCIAKIHNITLDSAFVKKIVESITIDLWEEVGDRKIKKIDLHGLKQESIELVLDIIFQHQKNEDFVLVVGRGNSSQEEKITEILDPILKINRPSGPIKVATLDYLVKKGHSFTYTFSSTSGNPNEGSILIAATPLGKTVVQNLSAKIAESVENNRLSSVAQILRISPGSQHHSPAPGGAPIPGAPIPGVTAFMPISPALKAINAPAPSNQPPHPAVPVPSILVTAATQDRLPAVQNAIQKSTYKNRTLTNKDKIKYLLALASFGKDNTSDSQYTKARNEILNCLSNESDPKFKYLTLSLLKQADAVRNYSSNDIDQMLLATPEGGFKGPDDSMKDNDFDPDPDYEINYAMAGML